MLQLGKLSNDNFNDIVMKFHQKASCEDDLKIINNVMENYFSRQDIKPVNYLLEHELEPLQQIWEKYHHIVMPTEPISAKTTSSSIGLGPYKSTIRQRHTTDARILVETPDMKKKKIELLRKENCQKDSIIDELTK